MKKETNTFKFNKNNKGMGTVEMILIICSFNWSGAHI